MCCILFLQPSKFEENRIEHARLIAIFLSGGATNTKKLGHFEGIYLSDGWVDSVVPHSKAVSIANL